MVTSNLAREREIERGRLPKSEEQTISCGCNDSQLQLSTILTVEAKTVSSSTPIYTLIVACDARLSENN